MIPPLDFTSIPNITCLTFFFFAVALSNFQHTIKFTYHLVLSKKIKSMKVRIFVYDIESI